MSEPTSPPWPVATTRLVALLGFPARYSLSPVMHNAAFREHGIDLVYVVLPCELEELAAVVDTLKVTEAVGANVTIPHKQAVVELCDELSPEAQLVGAVNTLTFGEATVGDNTDALGLRDAWTADVALERDDTITILGTGGAARAAAVAAGRLGCQVVLLGRRADVAREVADVAERAGASRVDAMDLDGDVEGAVAAARLIVNATPMGMNDEDLPEPFMNLTPDQVAYDLVYDPPETPFLRAAAAAGAQTHHGLGMLVAQAGRSFERWTGQPAPLGLMSAAALHALAETPRPT